MIINCVLLLMKHIVCSQDIKTKYLLVNDQFEANSSFKEDANFVRDQDRKQTCQNPLEWVL